jgi:hypothetical protein
MTPVPCESWNLTSPTVSRVYLAIHLLQSAFIAALKSIAAGRMAPIAAGLILAVTVLSTIWALHSHLVLLPDPWGIAVVLIACGILVCSVWIAMIAKRRAVLHGLKAFNGEPLDSDPDPADPEIEIMVRLTARGSGILGKRRCIVTVRYPIEDTHIVEDGVGNSPNGDRRRYTEQDHKLPFWVKR